VLDWLWNTPLANRIARAELNPLIKGAILTGDLNQRYESGTKGERALAVQTGTTVRLPYVRAGAHNQENESLEDLLTIMGRDLAMVKREMARLVQRDESADIKGHTRRNNELMVQGRMKTVIRKIIEKPDRSSTIEVVDRPEGPITDPKKIDEYLTGEWKKKFQHPEDSLPHYLGLETPHSRTTPSHQQKYGKDFWMTQRKWWRITQQMNG
jgi:hypothetical protein